MTLAAAYFCAMFPAKLQDFIAAALFSAVDMGSALLLRAVCVSVVAAESSPW